MFSKSTTAISSLLFFLSINPQIAKAQHLNDPTIHLRDSQIRNSSQEDHFSEFEERESKATLHWCAPIGLGLGDFEQDSNKYPCVPINLNGSNDYIKLRNQLLDNQSQ